MRQWSISLSTSAHQQENMWCTVLEMFGAYYSHSHFFVYLLLKSFWKVEKNKLLAMYEQILLVLDILVENHLFRIQQILILCQIFKWWIISLITGQNVQKLHILLLFASCIASILNVYFSVLHCLYFMRDTCHCEGLHSVQGSWRYQS